MKKKSKLSIENSEQWFEACGRYSNNINNYEQAMLQYYKAARNNVDSLDIVKFLGSRHNSSFWISYEAIPKKFVKLCIISIPLGLFIGAAIGVIIAFIISIVLSKIMPQNIISIAKILPFILALLGSIVLPAIIFVPKVIKIVNAKKILDKEESIFIDFIQYIPKKYRNYFCISAIYEVYCTCDVNDITQALEVCQTHIENNSDTYIPIMICNDIQYNNNLADYNNVEGDIYGLSHIDIDSNQLLPSDINLSILLGSDDVSIDINNLVGLQGAKSLVESLYKNTPRRGKARVNFVFIGNDNTGKRTFSKILSKVLYDIGFIRFNRSVEIDFDTLKSRVSNTYLDSIQEMINLSEGGLVLFRGFSSVINKNDDESKIVLDLIESAVCSSNNEITAVFIGSEQEISRIMSLKPEIVDTIKSKLSFNDFSSEELALIAESKLYESGKTMSFEAKTALQSHFEKEKKKSLSINATLALSAADMLDDISSSSNAVSEVQLEDIKKYIEMKQEISSMVKSNFSATKDVDSSIISLDELSSRTQNGSNNYEQDLSKVVGLDEIKKQFNSLKSKAEFYGSNKPVGHIALLGNPGTGKTMIVKIITGFLYDNGYIQENKFLDITGDFLRGAYVGHTGKRTEAVIKYCKGMVLFIDEAYLLNSKRGDPDSFALEAVGVLINAMEKLRKDLVVILAGYEDDMISMMSLNEGLESRISNVFKFENYSGEELVEILQKLLSEDDFCLSKNSYSPLINYFSKKRLENKFSNARFVRELSDKVEEAYILRHKGEKASIAMEIEIEDINEALKMIEKKATIKLNSNNPISLKQDSRTNQKKKTQQVKFKIKKA